MLKKSLSMLTAILVIVSLCSCTSEKNVSKKVEQTVKAEWHATVPSPNKKTTSFQYYVPKDLSVKSSGTSNVFFRDGKGNPYILFVNLNEGLKSKVNYVNDQVGLKQSDFSQTFSDANSFSYIIIRHLDHKQYELIIDRGGVKMSARTTLNQLAQEAKDMAKVVHSVKLIPQKTT